MQPLADSLQALFDHCGDALARPIERRHRPLYRHRIDAPPELDALEAHRSQQSEGSGQFRFYDAQVKAIGETVAMLAKHKAGFMVADCGAGKTAMATAAVHLAMRERLTRRPRFSFNLQSTIFNLPYRVLVMCPNHLAKKWKREIEWLLPDTEAVVIRKFHDVVDLRQRRRASNLYVIISKDRAKLGHHVRMPCAAKRLPNTPIPLPSPNGGRVQGTEPRTAHTASPRNSYPPFPVGEGGRGDGGHRAACPSCYAFLLDAKGTPVPHSSYHHNLKAKPVRCPACNEWATTHARGRIAKPHIDRYINRHMKGFFDAFIADEVHELKGSTTEQGNALGTLASSATYVLALTGTISGGYAVNLHALLWRIAPDLMRTRGFDLSPFAHGKSAPIERNEDKFQRQYGVMRKVTTHTGRDAFDDRDSGTWQVRGRGRQGKRVKEFPRPGQSPELFSHFMLGRSVFLGLDEIAAELPEIGRDLHSCGMSGELEEAYHRLAAELAAAIDEMKQKRRGNPNAGPPPLACLAPKILMDYLDHPWGWQPITVPDYDDDGECIGTHVVATPRDLGEGWTDEKDTALVRYCRDELNQARKVAVFATSTGIRDVRPKLARALLAHGVRVGVLAVQRNTDSVLEYRRLANEFGDQLTVRASDAPVTREAWLESNERKFDVLLVNPERVMTGLDLLAFPTLAWYQVGWRTFVLRQASARARRPGQTQDCTVAYFYYHDTRQHDCLALMGEKEAASMALEGRFDVTALRCMLNGDDEDIMIALSQSMGKGLDVEGAWQQVGHKRSEASSQKSDFKPGEIPLFPNLRMMQALENVA